MTRDEQKRAVTCKLPRRTNEQLKRAAKAGGIPKDHLLEQFVLAGVKRLKAEYQAA